MISSDQVFISLPKATQTRIDDAFYFTINSLKRKSEPAGGGGFIVDDDDRDEENDQIPLDLVPATLKHLNLPEDDDEILAVFRNAATGWTSSLLVPQGFNQSTFQLGVSLDDWRSVCAVLLEEDEDEEDVGRMESDGYGEDSDTYEGRDSESEGSASDEEFVPGLAAASSKAKRTRKSAAGEVSNAKILSKSQKQAALDTFALFFPDTPPSELSKQRIMIKDIQRVAGLLKEKLKADEIVDMLEMFSTSPDKSVSYDDFTRMLTTANLI
ncbi:hypothetical protein EST38_g9297 [Candolleomyces aberdarensis]|uniref:Uncharacterized protein n=1 Tax=Candolleomyces aberdarensis TaxID=2316362 RepID=A0A4Q2DB37_9AGAR|nr:hypothetical protein EST38_g9297 [Candolleomyces aberdarensis]